MIMGTVRRAVGLPHRDDEASVSRRRSNETPPDLDTFILVIFWATPRARSSMKASVV